MKSDFYHDQSKSVLHFAFGRERKMEDDDIEYDITFPSPVSIPDEDEEDVDDNYLRQKEPVVILLGWLGCHEKHIAKYSQIYDQRG